jgi:hypothetical protein
MLLLILRNDCSVYPTLKYTSKNHANHVLWRLIVSVNYIFVSTGTYLQNLLTTATLNLEFSTFLTVFILSPRPSSGVTEKLHSPYAVPTRNDIPLINAELRSAY